MVKGKASESRWTPGLLYSVEQSYFACEIKKFVQKFLQFFNLAMDGACWPAQLLRCFREGVFLHQFLCQRGQPRLTCSDKGHEFIGQIFIAIGFVVAFWSGNLVRLCLTILALMVKAGKFNDCVGLLETLIGAAFAFDWDGLGLVATKDIIRVRYAARTTLHAAATIGNLATTILLDLIIVMVSGVYCNEGR